MTVSADVDGPWEPAVDRHGRHHHVRRRDPDERSRRGGRHRDPSAPRRARPSRERRPARRRPGQRPCPAARSPATDTSPAHVRRPGLDTDRRRGRGDRVRARPRRRSIGDPRHRVGAGPHHLRPARRRRCSTVSSRPTPRSRPATPAGRSSTPSARWSASTRRSPVATPRSPPATSASRSPSRRLLPDRRIAARAGRWRRSARRASSGSALADRTTVVRARSSTDVETGPRRPRPGSSSGDVVIAVDGSPIDGVPASWPRSATTSRATRPRSSVHPRRRDHSMVADTGRAPRNRADRQGPPVRDWFHKRLDRNLRAVVVRGNAPIAFHSRVRRLLRAPTCIAIDVRVSLIRRVVRRQGPHGNNLTECSARPAWAAEHLRENRTGSKRWSCMQWIAHAGLDQLEGMPQWRQTVILGEKVGMTQKWVDDKVVPVTVLRVEPMRVVQIKTDRTRWLHAPCR